MLATQLPDRPPACTDSQFGARQRDRLVLFHERADRTRRFRTHPPAFTPHDRDRASHRRRIHQTHVNAAVTVSDDPTRVAPHHAQLGLDRHGQRPGAHVTLDRDHTQPVEPDKDIATPAIVVTSTPTQRRLGPVSYTHLRAHETDSYL